MQPKTKEEEDGKLTQGMFVMWIEYQSARDKLNRELD